MEYEEIRLLKQSEKSTVHLVREKNGEKVFIRKILKGRHYIYITLQNCRHPYLAELYEVSMDGDTTTIIEEYVEGQSLGVAELSEEQLISAFKELCSVLEYLHGKDIIHRDIKPSNIIFAKDGHIRLIDFDAARMPKEDLEQDTRLLGTRGYAPPEQYGFAQTDARTDIYALGITLKQLLGDRANKLRYKNIIQKCTNLNPDKRYQSVRQLKNEFSRKKRYIWYAFAALLLAAFLYLGFTTGDRSVTDENMQSAQKEESLSEGSDLIVLPAPQNPHWNAETGIALWGNVPESGNGDGEVGYYWRLYRRDSETPPDPEKDTWDLEGDMRGNGSIDENTSTYSVNLSGELQTNGVYYFAVSAQGDKIHYADSPYVISDAFVYTGEAAPQLPAPTGLEWLMFETDEGREYYATWSNLDDYEDTDSFNVCVYDKDGNYVMNNIWEKWKVVSRGYNGIRIRREFLTDLDGAYRFTVEVYTSRPNDYKSFLMPDPIPEEYYSPWYYR
ncbi:MAG: serine/threonine-protein kinase [Eubacteriales bacterium]|nr:serine/threonine-protein kinase [Eubacteriales bacterium]